MDNVNYQGICSYRPFVVHSILAMMFAVYHQLGVIAGGTGEMVMRKTSYYRDVLQSRKHKIF